LGLGAVSRLSSHAPTMSPFLLVQMAFDRLAVLEQHRRRRLAHIQGSRPGSCACSRLISTQRTLGA
jgi:hypothetical protein